MKVLLNEDHSTAHGINFFCNGTTYDVFASKEIILSAGTIGSPRLLELSGIGNPEILQAAGVECVLPLEQVGQLLQEHPMTSISYLIGSRQFANEEAEPGGVSLMAFVPFASIVSQDEIQQRLSQVDKCESLSEAERRSIAARLCDPLSGLIQLNGTPARVDIGVGHADQSKLISAAKARQTCYTFHVTTTSVLSRGSTHITSTVPYDAPKIDLGLLQDQTDVDFLAAGVEFADRVFLASDFVKQGLTRIHPSPEVDLGDRDQGRQYVRDWTTSFNHMIGTCAMGDVVDERLHVKGIRGLRVVDAGVMPTQISGNIIATVYAVAEKAADLIKRDFVSSRRQREV